MSFDPNAVHNQIGLWARASLGARDWAYSLVERYVQFRIGAGNPHRVAIVQLNGKDLYDVEIARLKRRTYEWAVEAEEKDIYADQLAETLIRLHDEVCSR